MAIQAAGPKLDLTVDIRRPSNSQLIQGIQDKVEDHGEPSLVGPVLLRTSRDNWVKLGATRVRSPIGYKEIGTKDPECAVDLQTGSIRISNLFCLRLDRGLTFSVWLYGDSNYLAGYQPKISATEIFRVKQILDNNCQYGVSPRC